MADEILDIRQSSRDTYRCFSLPFPVRQLTLGTQLWKVVHILLTLGFAPLALSNFITSAQLLLAWAEHTLYRLSRCTRRASTSSERTLTTPLLTAYDQSSFPWAYHIHLANMVYWGGNDFLSEHSHIQNSHDLNWKAQNSKRSLHFPNTWCWRRRCWYQYQSQDSYRHSYYYHQRWYDPENFLTERDKNNSCNLLSQHIKSCWSYF